MKVKYFADIRDLTRENEVQWSGRARTLDELLRALSARYGEPFRRRIFQGEALSDSIIVLVNGRDIRHLGGVAAPVAPSDTISIFPVVAGG